MANPRRLSALDASFLRLESAEAHMHVGWSGIFSVPPGHDRPTLEALRDRVASRIDQLGWCRWRLQRAPLGLSEPRWVDDDEFDLSAHVRALTTPDDPVTQRRFDDLRDVLFSRPLDQSRPPWEICLIPRLADGGFALAGKIHHSLVDGIAALQIVNLVIDEPPDATGSGPEALPRSGRASALGWAIGELTQTACSGVGLLRASAGAATHPRTTAGTAIRDLGRVVSAARADMLPKAPQSPLNRPIGPHRTLVGYHASRAQLRAARTAEGGTLNDIGLALVAGALRTVEQARGGEPPETPLKAMVPVSMRRPDEAGPGNRISMVFIPLPVHLASPIDRLQAVRAQTQALKSSERARDTETLYAAGGLLPAPLRSPVVKALSSPRVFNVTISQSPGPRGAVHVLGNPLDEVYSVVPIAQRHSLAIGMVRYRRELFIGCYADPVALPEVHELPALLEAELHALAGIPDHAADSLVLPVH